MLSLLFSCWGRNPSYLVWPEGLPTTDWQQKDRSLAASAITEAKSWMWEKSKEAIVKDFCLAKLKLQSLAGKQVLAEAVFRRDADPDYGYSQVLEKTLNLINTMVEAELDNSRVYVPYSWKRFMRWSGCFSKDRSLAASGCINSHLCVITASLSWRGSWARSCGFQFYIRSMLQPSCMDG